MVYNDALNYERFIDDLINAQKNLSLVCFVGAGVSISQGYPDWNQYVSQLINYWTYHLNELVANEHTRKSKVDLNDVHVLESLLSSSESNKRKVDLVNYIVKNYCECEEEKLSKEVYELHVLDFEKFLFTDVNPVISHNEVLRYLVKLNASFITTNYDSQIENNFKQGFGTYPEIVETIEDIIGAIKTESVIHLHGTPNSNNELFVSSSKSYKNVYYKTNGYRKKIEQLFENKKDLLILFVGCSMEEDEVLSLLNIESLDGKFYSLMKYSTSHFIGAVNERKNSLIKNYYESEHKVKTIWYGSQYSDLPTFIEKIILSIESRKRSISRNPNELRRIMLDEE